MLLRLSYVLCIQIITINCPTSYATGTKQTDVDNVNKAVNIYSNRTITRNYVVHAKNTPVSINEKINIFILPETKKVVEDKQTAVSNSRDVEEIEPLSFKTKSPISTQGVYGVEWFGKGIKKAPPARLRVPRSVMVNHSPETPLPRIIATIDNKTFGQDSSLNIIADFLIDMLRKQISQRGQDQIKIPEIHESFHKRIGPIKVKGTFDAVNGWFRSLTSLHRTTDVSASRRGDILSVEVGVGLASMVLGYDNYKAKFEHIGPKGKIKGEVDHNSLVVELAVDITNPGCKVSLQNLYFKEFSELKIHLTGLGKLSWTFSKIVSWITDRFRGDIVHSAENILKENVEKILSRFHCSSDQILTVRYA